MVFDMSFYSSAGGRSVNEDSVYTNVNDKNALIIVADGLGAYGTGKEASSTAVDIISSVLDQSINKTDEKTIINAFEEANSRLSLKEKALTTAAVLTVNYTYATAAYVGDTRIYQFRNGRIIYQSVDHSVSQMAVFVGEITQDQIRGHCDRNKLLKAVGMNNEITPEIKKLSIEPNDAFLLCSDGFWEIITEEEMTAYLSRSETAEDWLSEMRKTVDGKQNEHSDNNSAAVLIIK